MSKSETEQFCAKSLAERLELSSRLKAKHPGHLPLILDVSQYRGKLPENYRWKFLCPEQHRLSQVYWEIIRSGMQVSFAENIHFCIYDSLMRYVMPAMSSSILEIYNKYGSNDGFLYVYIQKENTFG